MLSHSFYCHSRRRALYPERFGLRTLPEKASGVFAFMLAFVQLLKQNFKKRMRVGVELVKFMQQNWFRLELNCQLFENPYKINSLFEVSSNRK